MKTVITVTIVIIDAADTASFPDDVTALQDNVMEDANRDGTLTLVSKVGVAILLKFDHL